MSFWTGGFLNNWLSNKTSIFGLRLWVIVGILVGAFIVLILFLLSLCFTTRRRSPRQKPTATATFGRPGSGKTLKLQLRDSTPPVSKDIPEIVHNNNAAYPLPVPDVHIDIGKTGHRVVLGGDRRPAAPPALPSFSTTGTVSGESRDGSGTLGTNPEVSHLGWGHWFTLRELEESTGGLAEENVIGEGGYGIVYRGVLKDQHVVAIKNLLNNRGQAEKEFKVEVEIIGRVRHKNLVRLLGYCMEGAYRMLVYEYVDNGNLDQWLHGDIGEFSPLTWEIRMNIILGTAKGLAYLHEGLEPKVVHRDVKSSNILLDRQWNPKVSDFGLAKLLGSEVSYVTTRVMGTFGYVAPEYASTGMLNERSDVYSFGVLIMEIITGRSPVDYSRPPGEVNLIEWLKNMVSERKAEMVVDTKIRERPSSKAVKRALLVALRCVDPDAVKRPKMGHVIHMLEVDELHCRDDRKVGRDGSSQSSDRYNTTVDGSFRKRDNQSRW